MKSARWLLILSSLFSISSYGAGYDYYEPEPCQPEQCQAETGSFHLGIEGVYVKPSSSSFLYAINAITDANNNTVGKMYSADPHAHWAYHADITYAMPYDYPDFYLGWTHMLLQDGKARRQISGSLFGDNLGGLTVLNVNGVPLGVARGRTEYDYTDIDLLVGKQLSLRKHYQIHTLTGLRYASLTGKDRGDYFLNGATVGYGQINNNFCGVGPRVVVDGAIDFKHGFNLVTQAAGSMLVGSYTRKYATFNPNGIIGTQGSTMFKSHEDHRIIPETDYRMALNYTYEFMPKTSMGIELGWTTVIYYDVLDKSDSRLTTTAGAMSDWSYQGPYLRLQFNFW